MATATRPFLPASKRGPRVWNSRLAGIAPASAGASRLARLPNDVGHRLELGLVEPAQHLGDLLQRAGHALLQSRPALSRARHEHRAPIAAIGGAPNQRLILQ